MKRVILVIVALALPAMPASAQDAVSDHVGTIGFGYFSSEAPVGIRYWASPSFGLDLGFGFDMQNQVPIDTDGNHLTDPGATTTLVDVAVEAGLVLPMASEENMILFFRPGIRFKSEGEVAPPIPPGEEYATEPQSKESASSFALGAMIGAELFLGRLGLPNVSFSGGVGIEMMSQTPAGGGDSVTTIATSASQVSIVNNASLGFHIYLD